MAEEERQSADAAPRIPDSGFRIPANIVLLIIIALLIYSALPVVIASGSAIWWPYQLDREEAFLLHQAMQLRAGETIYPPLSEYPLTVGNYTPLYPAVYALVLLVAEAGLGPGRAIVFASMLLLGGAGAAVAWRFGRSIPAALLVPSIFWGLWDVGHWGQFARVDFPALLLGFAGFAVAVWRGGTRATLIGGAVLCAAAFFTKQTQLVAPAAVVAWLMAERRWQDAAWFAGVLAGLGAVIGIALVLATGGQFWLHTVTYNANEMYWNQIPIWARHVWRFTGWLLVALVILGGAVAALKHRVPPAEGSPRLLPLLIYLGLALLSTLTIAKAGSAANYLLEWDLLLAVTLAALIGRLMGQQQDTPAFWPRLAVLGSVGVLLVAHAFSGFRGPLGIVRFTDEMVAQARPPHDEITLRVADAPGPVLAEEPIFNLLTGREVWYQPFIMQQLAREAAWDQSPFLENLRKRKWSLIITTQDLSGDGVFMGWTPDMRRMIMAGYYLEQEIPALGRRYFLYVPRS